MRTLVTAALGVALLLSAGCSLTIDPNSVEAPNAKKVTPRGACVTTTGHKLCGGQISAGGGSVAAASGHKVARSDLGTSTPNVSSAQHQITLGDVSP